jgi:inner membrane protein
MSTVRARPLGLLVCAAVLLLLQIPIALIGSLVQERQGRQQEAVSEVSDKWGGAQTVTGPWLSVPTTAPGLTATGERASLPSGRIHVLPKTMIASGDLDVSLRHRGLFTVPTFVTRLTITGRFDPGDVRNAVDLTDEVQWSETTLSLGVSDASAIRSAQLTVDGEAVELVPDTAAAEGRPGLHAEIRGAGEFHVELELAGTSALFLTPAGQDTKAMLSSTWGSPSFQGRWLPTSRDVSSDGFDATWSVSALARALPKSWDDFEHATMSQRLQQTALGVAVLQPIDHYRMVERAIKYSFLFVGLALLTLWIVESNAPRAVHPVQYGLVGAALCVFFLLLLAFGEHVGFATAYGVASLMICGLLTVYARSLLGVGWRWAAVSAVLFAMHGWLFVTLQNENYALLMGSLGVFVGLALTMFATRGMRWSGTLVGLGLGGADDDIDLAG